VPYPTSFVTGECNELFTLMISPWDGP